MIIGLLIFALHTAYFCRKTRNVGCLTESGGTATLHRATVNRRHLIAATINRSDSTVNRVPFHRATLMSAFVHASSTLAANPRLLLCYPCGVAELRPDMFVTLSHPHFQVTFVTPHGGVKPK